MFNGDASLHGGATISDVEKKNQQWKDQLRTASKSDMDRGLLVGGSYNPFRRAG